MNEEIVELMNIRDKKDETTEKLSIYRHQAAAVARKKELLAEKLQDSR